MTPHTHQDAGPYGYCRACERAGWVGIAIGTLIGMSFVVLLLRLGGG